MAEANKNYNKNIRLKAKKCKRKLYVFLSIKAIIGKTILLVNFSALIAIRTCSLNGASMLDRHLLSIVMNFCNGSVLSPSLSYRYA